MARQKSKKQSSGLVYPIIAIFGLVALAAAAAFFFLRSDDPEIAGNIEQCVPRQVASLLDNNQRITAVPRQINMFFDGSGGMAGYVNPSLGSANIIGNLISASRNFTQSGLYEGGQQGKIVFRSFGEKVSGSIKDPESFARPAAYRCPQGGCDNQETRIDTLLRTINAERNKDPQAAKTQLNIIVTDLMLDNSAAVDSFEASVGGQLRTAVIEENLAVGILGTKVGFDGNIYHEGRKFNARVERPLVMLLIGQPKHVRAFYEYLQSSEIPGLDAGSAGRGKLAFALFGQEPGTIALQNPQVRRTQTGFAKTRVADSDALQAKMGGLPQYAADASAAGGDEDGAGLAVGLAANATVGDFEVIGNEPVYTSQIWRLNPNMANDAACAPGALWTTVGRLPKNGWISEDQDIGYLLNMDTLDSSPMRTQGTYLVQVIAGQTGLNVPHSAAAWMDEWAMTPQQITANLQKSAKVIGAPGLSRVRKILETELKSEGNATIPRSASHYVLKVE